VSALGARPGAALMVCGTTSGAGKSFLVTALARWYARRGVAVAPFKAQNMSNNARVVEGGEIGSAQYFQALAARTVPTVDMNPVLLKPETDTRSQVVVLGQRDDRLSAMPWRERSGVLWPIVRESLDRLRSRYELVLIEGAGSPAEINLSSSDIVNMRVAATAAATTLIVCDIDRGGAFAHLYGTHQLLPASDRALIRGFVLNKFRGDARLLAPGPQRLEALTGVPTLGVLPMWREHGLPEEDGVFDAGFDGVSAGGLAAPDNRARQRSVVVVAYPRLSNLDEFAALRRIPGVSLRWARRPESVAGADLLILPGSKHVASDLNWLRESGLDRAIVAHVGLAKPTLAICGGLQMLGTAIRDPHGVEGAGDGLNLLPLATEFAPTKRCRRGRYAFHRLEGPWAPLSEVRFDGYEIRHGETHLGRTAADAPPLRPALPDGCGWQADSVLAVYTHGLFENGEVLRALFGADAPTLDDTFDGLADFVGEHLGESTLEKLIR
jgi:adenosylcobyric acid synthase